MSTTPPTPSTPGLTPAQLNYAESAQWKQIIRQALADTRCASPAFLVQDLDPEAQTVAVQIAIQERVRTPNGQAWWDVPPIVNVPIVTPRGGGYSVTLPLKKGDQGLLVFCDTCFDLWWQNGQENSPPVANVPAVSPNPSGSQRQFEVRRHYVHDCGFIPGMWSQNNVLANYSTDALQIRADDGSAVLEVNDDGTVSIFGTSGVGSPQVLMNDTFYQWFVTVVMPFLVSKGFAGTVPLNSETTILKGQ